MKTIQKATLSILALSFPFFLQAQDSTAEVAEAAVETAAVEEEAEYTKDEIFEAWGWYLGQQINLVGLNMTDEEVAAVSVGLLQAARNEDSRFDLETIAPFVQDYLASRAEEIQASQSVIGKQAEQQFLSNLDADGNVIILDSGLRYEIIEQGTGVYPMAEDVVVVHYTGTLLNGTVFDSSIPRGEPASFPLNQVISGWTQGLQKISEGGKIRLYVPADLAYGDEGRPGIPPASTLIFEVELLEVKEAIPEPAAASAPGMP